MGVIEQKNYSSQTLTIMMLFYFMKQVKKTIVICFAWGLKK